MSALTESSEQQYRMPSATCLTHAFKLAIVERLKKSNLIIGLTL